MVPNLCRIWIVFIELILLLDLPSAYTDINIRQSGTTSNSDIWNIPSFSTINNDVYTTCTNSSTTSTYVSYTVKNSNSSSALTLRVRAIFDFSSFSNTPYIVFYQHTTSYEWTADDAQSCKFFLFASTSTSASDLFVLVEPEHTLQIYLSGPSSQYSGQYVIEVTQIQQTTLTTDSSSFWKYPTTPACSPQSFGTVPFSKFQFDYSLCDLCDISLISFEYPGTNPVFALYKSSSSSFESTINTCQASFVQAVTSSTQIATLRNFNPVPVASFTVVSSTTSNNTAYLGLSVSPSLYGTTTTAQRIWNPPIVPPGQQQSSCTDGTSTTLFQSYTFKVLSPNTFFFDTLQVSTEDPFDAALYLYSGRILGTPSCSQFVKAGDSGNGGAIVVDLTPGNYTLVVSSRSGTSSGSYLLHGLANQIVNLSLVSFATTTSATTSASTTGIGSTTGSSSPSTSPTTPTPTSAPSSGPSPLPTTNPSTIGMETTQGTSGRSTTGDGTSNASTTDSSTTQDTSQSPSGAETTLGGQLLIVIIAAVAGSAALGILIGLVMVMRRKANKSKKDPEGGTPNPAKEHADGECTPMEPIQKAPDEIDQHRLSETPSGSALTTSEFGSQPKSDSNPATSTSSFSQTLRSTTMKRKDTHPIYGNVILDDPYRLKFILDRDMTICEKLGDGFFGEVYRGLWQGKEVALKSFKEEDDDPTAFLNEAKLLQKLEHPNIVSFLGIFLGTNRRRYIVMEYMNGGSLHRFLMLKKNIVTVTDLVEMALQATAGMVFLESQSVVHRDLALRNLLVSFTDAQSERDRKSTPRRGSQLHQETRWVVKVADFGLSRRADPGFYTSQTRTIPVKWSAPEVLLYQTYNYTSKCDMWSFGVVLWELFSFGMTPYPALSNAETIEHIQSGYRMPKPKQCPAEVYAIMLQCWEFEPEARPSFAEVHHQLQGILQAMVLTHKEDNNNTNA